eukprot:TRINITY_DN6563_c0_g1_i1.p1 TRINITY_DN6563_c0_g1~~TRINITY_DN6563_c0_g1_i1.p1  ORF type:complete len:303 (-),score=26.76 TRINITY_DN6563_c0_g1_i1:824-1732(-)
MIRSVRLRLIARTTQETVRPSYKSPPAVESLRGEPNAVKWGSLDKQRQFFKECESKLGITSLDQWYKITASQVEELGGAGLIANYYGRSLQSALSTIYPNHHWRPWLFRKTPRSFWNDKSNHRAYFDWLQEELGFADRSGWYSASVDQVLHHSASGVLWRFYNNSLILALTTIYSDHQWDVLAFQNVPKYFWKNPSAQRLALDSMGREMGFKSFEDWYSIDVARLKEHKCWSLIRSHYSHSLPAALQTVYPTHPWEPYGFKNMNLPALEDATEPKSHWNTHDGVLKRKKSDKWAPFYFKATS